jgi:hypothetical protein
MTRKLKIMGLALVAVLAMSAMAAQAAQAGVFETESGSSAAVTGEQIEGTVTGAKKTKHEFSTAAGVVKCSTATFSGTAAASSEELSLTPTYSTCTLSGLEATVDMMGCSYKFHAGATVGGSPDAVAVTTDVICTGENEITVSVVGSECRVDIPAQNGLTGITAEDTTTASPKMDVDAIADGEKIKYSIENGASCPNTPANGVHEDGTYKGVATIKSATTGLTVT